jgi:hypothetical protein
MFGRAGRGLGSPENRMTCQHVDETPLSRPWGGAEVACGVRLLPPTRRALRTHECLDNSSNWKRFRIRCGTHFDLRAAGALKVDLKFA